MINLFNFLLNNNKNGRLLSSQFVKEVNKIEYCVLRAILFGSIKIVLAHYSNPNVHFGQIHFVLLFLLDFFSFPAFANILFVVAFFVDHPKVNQFDWANLSKEGQKGGQSGKGGPIKLSNVALKKWK